jgi:hypothetical protein
MKFARLFTVILIAVFAVSIQLDAGFKKDLKKEIKKLDNDKKDKKDKKNKKAASEMKYDYEVSESGDMETDIKKLLPAKSEYNHRITQGIFGPADGTKGPIMIVPYVTGANKKVQLMLLIPGETWKYNKMMLGEIKFGKYSAEEVLSVFFDQSDKDKERELYVLCSYENEYETVFETAVYDYNKNKFNRVPAIESKIKDLYPAINVRRTLRAMENTTAGKKAKK